MVEHYVSYLFLNQFGLKPLFYIPDRLKDGYGLSNDGIREISNWSTKLIVTVDCGITAVEEVDLANSLGMGVIVSDHHEPADVLPNALAILNPKRKDCDYPFKELAGVGVAFKLIQGVCEKMRLDRKMCDQFLDLVLVPPLSTKPYLSDEHR